MKKKAFDCVQMVRSIRDRNEHKKIHDIAVTANNHVRNSVFANAFNQSTQV